MVQRPRTHRLEEESRNAFRSALEPVGWVLRDFNPDYGIDGEVEIFGEDEKATGLSFYAQFKGTDKRQLDKALAVRLRRKTADYYRAQALPVLVVVFHAPKRQLFVKWFHSFDPELGRAGTKTISFRLSEEDRWTDQTPAQLVSGVKAFRRWRSAQIGLPVGFGVEIPSDAPYGLPAGELLMRIRNAASRLPDMLRIERTDAAEDQPAIVVEEGRVLVDFQRVASVTSHRSDYDVEAARRFLPNDVMITVSLAFAQIGQMGLAAKIFGTFGSECSLIDDPEILFRGVGMFVQSHRISDALQLAERLRKDEQGPGSVASDVLLVSALATSRSLSEAEVAEVRNYVMGMLEHAEREGDEERIGTAHYNVARWFGGRGEWADAEKHYRRAAEHEPGYLDREYYWRELAGVLFELARYEESASAYERARQMGTEKEIRPRLADALMYAGKYRSALSLFDEYVNEAARPKSVWLLKHWALKNIIDFLGIEEQARRTDEAEQIAGDLSGLPEGDVQSKIFEAFELDALCGLAWFNLGVKAAKESKEDWALLGFVVAGLMLPGEEESWGNSVGLAIMHQDEALFVAIVETGYRYLGERFIDALSRRMERQVTGFPVQDVFNLVEGVIADMTDEEDPIEMRLLGEGSDYESFSFQRPSTHEKGS